MHELFFSTSSHFARIHREPSCYPGPNLNSYPNPSPNSDTNPYSDPNSDSNPDPNSNQDLNANPDPNIVQKKNARVNVILRVKKSLCKSDARPKLTRYQVFTPIPCFCYSKQFFEEIFVFVLKSSHVAI